ncbi:hypothetical protein C4K35_3948 [Pseudomonas chlororaphis subsp. piscium]|nr:hypothetical protein C4K35_3948 [Pseudomonas chlororaphis subsp. piscium]AZC58131.1 hypothetical protein C4K34_3970 [Pseudomonas chlororaphis subsp. piscium]AZC64337.1 hypothetical protein C4K33_3849 [Pseudomonas chlororaphis subsp. piscium]AZC70589.1 hypothetical protein C4K32_3931 [Pseudomonas chlororaphis subsp. piscium]AZC76820.1 hypothetical protein C4K31_3921 [Pseudomonas chlororaphis subsp. piscium]
MVVFNGLRCYVTIFLGVDKADVLDPINDRSGAFLSTCVLTSSE